MLEMKQYLEINLRNMGTILFLTWMTLVWLRVVKNFERKITLQIQFRGSTNWRIWKEHKAITLTQVPQGTSLSTICNLRGRLAGSGSHRSLAEPGAPLPPLLPLSTCQQTGWHQFIHLRCTKVKVFTQWVSSSHLYPNRDYPLYLDGCSCWPFSKGFHRLMSLEALHDLKFTHSTSHI